MNALPDDQCIITTARLTLNPIVQSDAESLFTFLREPALYEYTGGKPFSSAEELRNLIVIWEKRLSPEHDELWLNWTLRLKHNSTVIGYIQAGVHDEKADLAWVIGLPFQNQKYATEGTTAVVAWLKEELGVSNFSANIHPDHNASHSVARRIGLQRTAQKTDEGEEVWAMSI